MMTSLGSYGSIQQPAAVVEPLAIDKSATEPKKCSSIQLVRALVLVVAVVTVVGLQILQHQRNNSPNDRAFDDDTIGGESSLLGSTLLGAHLEEPVEEPNQMGPLYFDDQLVDHFSNDGDVSTWSQPYFTSDSYFEGPGSPIFCIIGGEGPVSKILYPYVTKKLAKDFGGFVLQTEHRFYGDSQPVGAFPSNDELKAYLSPEQAMMDWVVLIRHVQQELGCSTDRSSNEYCPVVTIGGSYPGFLSAMMRFVHHDVVDVGYASSAPLHLYEHLPGFDSEGYFDKITEVADTASPGCAAGYKQSLKDLHEHIMGSSSSNVGSVQDVANELGICVGDRFPSYIDSHEILAQELVFLVVASNADFNMDYYPPSADTDLVKGCRIFQDDSTSVVERYSNFLTLKQQGDDDDECFDLHAELPSGPNATLSSADWSGVGDGETGRMWEFQICRDLVVMTGYGSKSMFAPPRPWTLQWLTDHCQSRFDVTPQPGRLRKMWGFDNLDDASKLLFTNGLNDGWSVSSYTENQSNSILALNFVNGAHHSDLVHTWPLEGQTKDIQEGHEEIVTILKSWLVDDEPNRRTTWGWGWT